MAGKAFNVPSGNTKQQIYVSRISPVSPYESEWVVYVLSQSCASAQGNHLNYEFALSPMYLVGMYVQILHKGGETGLVRLNHNGFRRTRQEWGKTGKKRAGGGVCAKTGWEGISGVWRQCAWRVRLYSSSSASPASLSIRVASGTRPGAPPGGGV